MGNCKINKPSSTIKYWKSPLDFWMFAITRIAAKLVQMTVILSAVKPLMSICIDIQKRKIRIDTNWVPFTPIKLGIVFKSLSLSCSKSLMSNGNVNAIIHMNFRANRVYWISSRCISLSIATCTLHSITHTKPMINTFKYGKLLNPLKPQFSNGKWYNNVRAAVNTNKNLCCIPSITY